MHKLSIRSMRNGAGHFMFEMRRHELKEIACAICNVRPAMRNDILCGECSDRCEDLVKSARYRAMEISARSEYMQTVTNVEPKAKLGRQVTRAILESSALEERLAAEFLESRHAFQDRSLTNWKLSSKRVGYVILGIGLVALVLTATFITACFKFY